MVLALHAMWLLISLAGLWVAIAGLVETRNEPND